MPSRLADGALGTVPVFLPYMLSLFCLSLASQLFCYLQCRFGWIWSSVRETPPIATLASNSRENMPRCRALRAVAACCLPFLSLFCRTCCASAVQNALQACLLPTNAMTKAFSPTAARSRARQRYTACTRHGALRFARAAGYRCTLPTSSRSRRAWRRRLHAHTRRRCEERRTAYRHQSRRGGPRTPVATCAAEGWVGWLLPAGSHRRSHTGCSGMPPGSPTTRAARCVTAASCYHLTELTVSQVPLLSRTHRSYLSRTAHTARAASARTRCITRSRAYPLPPRAVMDVVGAIVATFRSFARWPGSRRKVDRRYRFRTFSTTTHALLLY